MSRSRTKRPVYGSLAWSHGSLLAVSAVWGSTFVMVKEAVTDGAPLTFVALRFALAASVMVVVMRRHLHNRSAWRAGVGVGVMLFAGFSLQTAGLQHTTATKAAFLTSLYVPLVPLVSWAVTRRRPSVRDVLAISVAAGGMGLLMLPVESLTSVNIGDALVAGCAVAFAAHIVAVGQLAPRHNVATLATSQVLTTAVLAACAAAAFERPLLSPSMEFVAAAAFTGVAATSVAFAVQTASQRHVSATRTALIFATEPLFAAGFGTMFAGETMSRGDTVGAVMILGSMVIAVGVPRRERPLVQP